MSASADDHERAVDGHQAVNLAVLVSLTLIVVFGALMALGSITPVTFVTAGQQGPSVEIITEDFGYPANPRPGYDGQQVYAIARAFPDLDAAADSLDNPAYRITRIVQPALASFLPAGPWLVFGLFVAGAIGIGLAVGAIADIAAGYDRDPRVALFAIPGLLLPVAITTTEALAYGLALVAVALLDRRRVLPAVVVGTVAVLTRETALLVLGFAALGALRRVGWTALLVPAIPGAVLIGWVAFLRTIVPGRNSRHLSPFEITQLSPDGVAIVLAIVAIGIVGAWAWRDVSVLWPVSLAFAALPLLLNTDVLDPIALPRVVAPALVLGLTGLAGYLFHGSRPVVSADR